MGKVYAAKEIREKCAEALHDPASFYAQDFVNYRGICPEAGVPYTELIADFLCDHFREYVTGIPVISRNTSYCTPTHDGSYAPTSNREEEMIAMQMFRHTEGGGTYAQIGKILDYQTPLKDRQKDKIGKIDLLAYDGDTLRILELKRPSTGETMLRCVLEGASPLVFEDSLPYKEYLSDCPNLKRLMVLLDSKPFFIRRAGNDFEIFE